MAWLPWSAVPPRLQVRGRAAVGSSVHGGGSGPRPWLGCAMVVVRRGLARAVCGLVVGATVGVLGLSCCVAEAPQEAERYAGRGA